MFILCKARILIKLYSKRQNIVNSTYPLVLVHVYAKTKLGFMSSSPLGFWGQIFIRKFTMWPNSVWLDACTP